MTVGKTVPKPFQRAPKWHFYRRLLGGNMLASVIKIQSEDFDFAEHYFQIRASGGEEVGAIAGFVGLVRDYNAHAGDGGEVATLTLEHYPGMTESSIQAIVTEAQTRWPLVATTVVHRVGTLRPMDQIVMVLAASAHRDAAFAAAEFIMDYLKTQAIFWKKEATDKGDHWIESTEADRQRAVGWSDKSRNTV